MNDISRMSQHDGHDPGDQQGFDPQLLRLFDAASQQTPLPASEQFVAAAMLQIRRAARARLRRRCALVVAIMTGGALLAPFIAETTLNAVDWIAAHLAAVGMTLVSPLGCLGAALLAWRVARRT